MFALLLDAACCATQSEQWYNIHNVHCITQSGQCNTNTYKNYLYQS